MFGVAAAMETEGVEVEVEVEGEGKDNGRPEDGDGVAVAEAGREDNIISPMWLSTSALEGAAATALSKKSIASSRRSNRKTVSALCRAARTES